jgi:phage shock protein A
MPESISTRLRRIARARMESLVDSLEQSSSPAVMAEAIREMERLMDEAQREKDQAVIRRLAAVRSQKLLRERLLDLEQKARFAIAEGREDLAEIALGRQIDFEAGIADLDGTIAAAAEEEERLAAVAADLAQRHDAMVETLKARQEAEAEADRVGAVVGGPTADRTRAADRAESAFQRALGGLGSVAGAPVADPETRKGLGEIERMARRRDVAERMAKLKESPAA